MDKRVVIQVSLVLMLLAALPAVLATGYSDVVLVVENGRKYIGPDGLQTKLVPFWYVAGDEISWWQGGARFVYYENASAQKVQTLISGLMTMFKDLGFVTLAGTVRPYYCFIVYKFDGILEYEGYWFIDGDGKVVVEWKEGEPLNITVYSKATVNVSASKIDSYGGADWGGLWGWPTATMDLPKLPYEILVVPRDGIVETDEAGVNYGPRSETRVQIEELTLIREIGPYPIYLGGGPELNVITSVGSLLNPSGSPRYLPHVTAKAYDSWWHRQPVYIFVHHDGEVEVWKRDLFYGYEFQVAG